MGEQRKHEKNQVYHRGRENKVIIGKDKVL